MKRSAPSRRPLLAALLLLVVAAGVAWWLSSPAGAPDAPPLLPDAGPDEEDGTPPRGLDAERRGPESGDGADGPGTGAPVPRAHALRGIVTDERVAPLRDARVELRPIDPQGLRGAPFPDGPRLAETVTDADGEFGFEAPFAGWARVVASARGRATVAASVPGPGAFVVIRLPHAAALRVHVVDADGHAVAEPLVTAQVEETRFEQRGGTDGVVEFGALAPGTARVRTGAAGHGTIVTGPYAVRAGERTDAVVTLPRGVPISGTVVDDGTGAAVDEAIVHVTHPGRSDRATTNKGRFGPVPGGGVGERVFVGVEADGYAPLLEPVVIGDHEIHTVTLRLRPASPWQGTVLHADDRPAAGAVVTYTPDGVAGRAPARTTADEQGRFRLPPPPPPAPGRRVVLYARLGKATAALAQRPGSPAPDPLILRLAEGGRVTGHVADPAGKPMTGVQVRLTPAWDRSGDRSRPDARTSLLLLANEQGFTGLAAGSGADGRWVVSGVPAGAYQVRYRWPAGSAWRAEVLEVAGAATDAGRETLGAGGRLSGRVTDRSGGSLAGVTLRLGPQSDARRLQRATSGPDGWFDFVGLADGAYLLRASFGTLPTLEETIQVRGPAAQRFDLRFDEGATLEGRVRKQAGGDYSGLLTVALRRAGRPRPDRAPVTLRVEGGRFRITDLRADTWVVEASGPGGLRGDSDPVDLDAGRITPVSIRLARLQGVRGRVATRGGTAVAGASVAVRHETSGRRHLTTSTAEGSFAFTGLAPGTWHAEVRGRGGAPGRASFEVREGASVPLELRLDAAGSLRVTVRDAEGRPMSRALVSFRGEDGTLATRVPTRTGRDGVAVVRDLPLGRLLVTARAIDGRRGAKSAVVLEDVAVEVDLTVSERDR